MVHLHTEVRGSEPQQDVVDQGDGQGDEHPEDHTAAKQREECYVIIVLLCNGPSRWMNTLE
jgi:hypothetical protein